MATIEAIELHTAAERRGLNGCHWREAMQCTNTAVFMYPKKKQSLCTPQPSSESTASLVRLRVGIDMIV